ncbi:MAG: hypothetical protein IIV43_04010, partial [Oscillospiraceae bacterium]|nr:hypothetical protein [Oscillospiraceae bacterium]
MKKRVMSMLMVMIMMVSMLSVSVFAAHEGTCTAATEWSSDAANHWHACVTEGCEITDVTLLPDYAAHAFDNTHKCTVCSYQGTHAWVDNGTDAVCDCGATHTHALAWVTTDAENHWQVCTDCPVDAAKKYNEAAHTWVKDDAASTATQEVFKCDCGATKSSHVHVWATTASYDASNHWYACTDTTCTETNGVAAHTLTQSGNVRACSICGYSEEHTHTWAKTMTWDGTYHWYECTDSACTEVKNKGEHHDNTSDYLCDIGDCDAKLTTKTLTSLTITGLGTPAEGAAVDFKVSVAESRYGTPSVKWNRVESLSKNTSTALGEGATFAAEEKYNVTIYVPINSKDEIAENMSVTLDGVKVPFYNSSSAFDAAIKTYEGNKTVYMAKNLWTYDQRYIIVSVMFAELGGSHSHAWGSDWIETPAKHYIMCTGCGEKKNSEYHTDADKSGLCDVCDFDMKYFNKNATASNTGSGTASHTHTYSADWVEDISNHWKQCTGCGAVTQKAAHA